LQLTRPGTLLDDRPTKEYLDTAVSVKKGAKVLFLLEDGSIIELVADEDFAGDVRFTPPQTGANDTKSYSITASVRMLLDLDADAVAALGSKGVTDIRVATTDGDIDVSAGRKPSRKILEELACVQ
jgi:hypothetical protein